MASNEVPLTKTTGTTPEYSASYMQDLVRALEIFIEQERNPGELRGTKITLTDLLTSATGLETGAPYNDSGNGKGSVMSILKNLGKTLKKGCATYWCRHWLLLWWSLDGCSIRNSTRCRYWYTYWWCDIEDALLAGALGYGAGSLASSAGIGMAGGAAAKTGATAQTLAGTKAMGMGPAQAQAMLGSGTQNAAAAAVGFVYGNSRRW